LPVTPSSTTLGDRPATERQHRRAARHGFDHHESKWLRPVHREQKSGSLTQEFCFLALVNLADKLYVRAIDEWKNLMAEVVAPYQSAA